MLETILSLFFFVQAPADNYSLITDALIQIAARNPQTSQVFQLGMSDSGKPILGLQVGNGGGTPVLIVATHHGNEYGSAAVAMGAAEAFAQDPLKNRTVYIIPVLNISGYNARTRQERTARGSIDPNRDYPGPCATAGPFYSKATKALADFVVQKNIVSSATLHTFSPAVLYPWGFSTRDVSTAYDSLFLNLAKAAAVESRYDVGNSKELLYAADGTFEDYVFWKHGVWSLLFEMGFSHSPGQNAVKEMIQVNVPGLRRFLETAPDTRAADHEFRGVCDMSQPKRVRLE
ncbi:MAG: M14 family metallopeptidase [Bdellovibrio sp.]|jgi:carboxypeptidase T